MSFEINKNPESPARRRLTEMTPQEAASALRASREASDAVGAFRKLMVQNRSHYAALAFINRRRDSEDKAQALRRDFTLLHCGA